MSRRQSKGRDPQKRAEKRKRQREAKAKGIKHTPKQPRPSQSQMTHASSSKANKKRREGQRKMEAEWTRDDWADPDDAYDPYEADPHLALADETWGHLGQSDDDGEILEGTGGPCGCMEGDE